MKIPHAPRDVACVDRTIVDAEPVDAFERLLGLGDLLDGHADVRVDGPADSELVEGARFHVVHRCGTSGAHAVIYDVAGIEAPTVLELRADCAHYRATHLVVVAPAPGEGAEVVWSTRFSPDTPVTRQVIGGAVQLQRAALRRLSDAVARPARWATVHPGGGRAGTDGDRAGSDGDPHHATENREIVRTALAT